jgi:hypothetical protein
MSDRRRERLRREGKREGGIGGKGVERVQGEVTPTFAALSSQPEVSVKSEKEKKVGSVPRDSTDECGNSCARKRRGRGAVGDSEAVRELKRGGDGERTKRNDEKTAFPPFLSLLSSN